MEELAANLAMAMEPYLDTPFAIYGHSLGGLVAFEATRVLRRRTRPQPACLLLGAAPSPNRQRLGPTIHALPRNRFVRELQRLGGTPDEVLQDSELLEFLLPALRADVEMAETYRHKASAPLDCPITVFRGTRDPVVADADLAGWEIQTRGAFRLERVEGGHFFVRDAGFLMRIAEELRPWAGRSGPARRGSARDRLGSR
jgi:surfactin synthase thioesterase subunit